MPNLKLTLKAWPVIALATIGLCFVTEQLAGLCGIKLPEQTNVEIVRKVLAQSFHSWRHFGVSAFLVAQVLVIMPAVEELIFRGLLVKGVRWLTIKIATAIGGSRAFLVALAVVSSALFSSAHYLAQPWPDNAFLALFFFGLAQCWLYHKTAHLWCPMLNHALFNLTNLVLLLVIPESFHL